MRKWLLIYLGVRIEILRKIYRTYVIYPSTPTPEFSSWPHHQPFGLSLIPLQSHWTSCSSSNLGAIPSMWHRLSLFSAWNTFPLEFGKPYSLTSISYCVKFPFSGTSFLTNRFKWQPFSTLPILSSYFILQFSILFNFPLPSFPFIQKKKRKLTKATYNVYSLFNILYLLLVCVG